MSNNHPIERASEGERQEEKKKTEGKWNKATHKQNKNVCAIKKKERKKQNKKKNRKHTHGKSEIHRF